MTFGPEIPQRSRPALCRAALDAQAACLALFDAIEAGEMVTVIHTHDALAVQVNELGGALRVHAAIALSDMERATGIKFGPR
jgi:hypothetical protein